MKADHPAPDARQTLSRRAFIKAGGAAVAAGSLGLTAGRALAQEEAAADSAAAEVPSTKVQRVLGRTGFAVSDISMGCGRIQEPNVVRYAYDHGINYFDTAEVYGNGDSETKIGQAMAHLDREKIFITTKIAPDADITREQYLERFRKCLERLQTDYADCLMQHGPADVTLLPSAAFHGACDQLKQEGRLRFVGVSCHGPQGDEPDSMEKLLLAAVEDGRYDVFLMSYNFMNKDEAERVLKACKEKNVGTTAMKTAPGVLEVPAFDEENPSEDFARYIQRVIGRGGTREEAITNIRNWLAEQEENRARTGPFMEKHGLKTEEELRDRSIQWVLRNPDMHTICVSMADFAGLDRHLPLSGTKLSRAGEAFLRDYEYAFGARYCRHGCTACRDACPHGLPVSTIMRYAYYYQKQGRERFAMQKYARLQGKDASLCALCDAPCTGACPHGVNVAASMGKADLLLNWA